MRAEELWLEEALMSDDDFWRVFDAKAKFLAERLAKKKAKDSAYGKVMDNINHVVFRDAIRDAFLEAVEDQVQDWCAFHNSQASPDAKEAS